MYQILHIQIRLTVDYVEAAFTTKDLQVSQWTMSKEERPLQPRLEGGEDVWLKPSGNTKNNAAIKNQKKNKKTFEIQS